MMRDIDGEHPIRGIFADALRHSLRCKLGIQEQDVETYLTDLMVAFLHFDGIYRVKDAEGRPVRAITDMVQEGDIRLKADSFARERDVHRHIGDFLLFWSGIFPEQLEHLGTIDALINPVSQGRTSYHIASTFTHPPYEEESKTLRKLSDGFVDFQYALHLVRSDVMRA